MGIIIFDNLNDLQLIIELIVIDFTRETVFCYYFSGHLNNEISKLRLSFILRQIDVPLSFVCLVFNFIIYNCMTKFELKVRQIVKLPLSQAKIVWRMLASICFDWTHAPVDTDERSLSHEKCRTLGAEMTSVSFGCIRRSNVGIMRRLVNRTFTRDRL